MILIKIGGGKNINLEYVCEDISSLTKQGEKIVLVHGANSIRDEIGEKLGVPTKIITSPSGVSSVYTDKAAMDVFLMAYAGLMNKKITSALQKFGVNAIGLSGVDGKLWEARKKSAVYASDNDKVKLITDNLTGKVEKVNSKLLSLLIENGYVPVCCPPAVSFEGEIVNTDGDFAAIATAEALGIKEVVMLFEAPGLLREVSSEASLIPRIKKEELEDYLKFSNGRMKKKLLAAVPALQRGVKKIYWGDGRIRNPIKSVLSGAGTLIE